MNRQPSHATSCGLSSFLLNVNAHPHHFDSPLFSLSLSFKDDGRREGSKMVERIGANPGQVR